MPSVLRATFLFALISLSAFAKDIRLRNELIRTPDKKPDAAALAQATESPVNALFLLQFSQPLTDAHRAELRRLNVDLIQSIPEDAFVARLSGVRPGAIRRLPFVHWLGPLRPEHKIDQRLADLKQKRPVSFLAAPNAPELELALLRKGIPGLVSGPRTSAGMVLRGLVDANQLNALANSPAILWIEPAPRPKLFDQAAVEIIGGESEAGGVHVHNLGFDGAGVAVAVADSGLMEGTAEGMHADLDGRVDAFFHYGRLTDAADEHGHGTHVAGIVAGDGSIGEADEFGYLYGLGMAPKSHIIAQRMFDGLGGYEAPESFEQLTRNAVQAGAVIGSNSWGDDTQGRYDLSAMEFDALVRDADSQTPGDQPYILEFSAGNAGPGEQTIGSPAVAKNVIATGASQNNRFDFFIYAEGEDTMADFSSRGPCEDGRVKPDLVAPGTWIASLQSSAATDENAWLSISHNYQYQGGTSQAGPHASGAAAIFVQFYRATHGGLTPSPALVKAALINSAVDMDPEYGTGPIPNNDEGWGRIDLTELIGGQRSYEFIDQSETLVQGQVFLKQFYVADSSLPLRFTLAYTDVPGSPLSIPALVNDLDLELIAPDGALYAGNQMIDAESVPGSPGRDAVNNVECVYIASPVIGEYTLRVRARRVVQDARRETPAIDQDFSIAASGAFPDGGHGFVSFDRRAYSAPATIGLKLIDFDLAGQAEAIVTIHTDSEPAPLSLTLRASGTVGVFTGSVTTALGPPLADDKLQVKHGDAIVATYQDASPLETVQAIRRADLLPPVISEVSSRNRFGQEAVSWTTDEPANGLVLYGPNRSFNQSVSTAVFRDNQSLTLTNLIEGVTYDFKIISMDEAGNSATNDNNGQAFSFVAQPASVVLLVNNYVHGPNDESEFIPLSSYTDALDRTGVTYEVWDIATDGQPQLADLLPFRVVIWRINDSFYDTTSISFSQQSTLETYLKRDGSLLIASMELLTRLGDTPFRTNVLQVAEFVVSDDIFSSCATCDQDHGMPILEGLPGDAIGSGVQVQMDYSRYPVFELEPIAPDIGPDLADTFTATTNAVPIFVDQSSRRPTGLRWPRDLKSPGRLVFLGFPLDAIPMDGPPPNNRVNILRNILSFLAPGVQGLGTISFDRVAYSVPDRISLVVADSDLAGQHTASVQIRSTTDPVGISVTLTETPRRGVFEGSLTLIAPASTPRPGQLRAGDGDVLNAEYWDASAASLVRVSSSVDTRHPAILRPHHEVDYEYAIVRWSSDEPSDSLVQFGESKFLTRTAFRSSLAFDHELVLHTLQPDRAYFYQIVSRDSAGNTTVDDNNGKLYTFRTLKPRSVPWSDDMEGPVDGWTVETTEDSEYEWELGVPNNGLDTAGHSGSKAWGNNLHGVPGTYTETALVSPAFMLTGGNRATLNFWHNYDFGAEATYERASLQIVTNSQTTPTILADYGDISSGWELEEIDLTPYIGKVVQLVWFYQLFDIGEEVVPHPGWLIDDVSISIRIESRGYLVAQANLSQASYAIDGPSPAFGSGFSFTNRAALSGSYTVTFDPVPYYITPPPQTKTLAPNGSIVFDGKYEITDSNHNLIADEWEAQFYGSVPALNDGRGDADADRATDYAEFIAGTSPIDPASKLWFEPPIFLPDGRIQLSWSAKPNRAYRVIGSTDTSAWTAYTPWIRSNGSRVVQTLPPLGSTSGHYFQIEVRP